MNYRQAEHLLAVYEEGSVSRAASRLGVSQPAISQTIQTAEREIGMRIFQRGPDGRSLTYAGEKYLSAARRLMALEGNLGRELQELRGEHSGKLRIGISSLRGMVLLPQILPGFLEQHSAVNPVLVEADSSQLDVLLLEGRIDLAFLLSVEKFIPAWSISLSARSSCSSLPAWIPTSPKAASPTPPSISRRPVATGSSPFVPATTSGPFRTGCFTKTGCPPAS